MDDYNQLIELLSTTPELALIPIALLIGTVVKKSKLKDEIIPVVVIVISAILGFLIAGADSAAAIKGFVAGLVAVGGVSGVKQTLAISSDKSDSNKK